MTIYGGARGGGKSELDAYIRERDEALRTLDMTLARKIFPSASCDEVLLAGMHKARAQIPTMPQELRDASVAWLLAHGYSPPLM